VDEVSAGSRGGYYIALVCMCVYIFVCVCVYIYTHTYIVNIVTGLPHRNKKLYSLSTSLDR